MKPFEPIRSIDEILKYDSPFPAFTPVIIFNGSWAKRMLRWLLALVILVCSVSVGADLLRASYYIRAYLPYPVNYVTRLHTLEFWGTDNAHGLNCSGFISAAHSSRFHHSYDFYENTFGDLTLVDEVAGRTSIDESKLQPGDIAAFHGAASYRNHGHEGVHVAAYLGNGLWIAADSRIGYVGHFKMSDASDRDPWFAGQVRLYRWNNAPKFSLTAAARNLGKDDTTVLR